MGMRKFTMAILALALLAAPALPADQGVEGTLRVFLLVSQRAGPEMLNKIVGDIGVSSPTPANWGRKMTMITKLAPDTYTLEITNVQACHFKDCVPCPSKRRDTRVLADQTTDEIFRWKAKYDRAEKKWVCQ